MFSPFPKLKRCVLDITTRCNARCVFCPNIQLTDRLRGPDWDMETFQRVLPQFAEAALVCFCSPAGEPFLNPHLGAMLEACKRAGQHTEFFTNGASMAPGARLDHVLDHTDSLVLSFVSTQASIHEKWMTRTSLDHVQRNLAYMRSRPKRPSVDLHVLLMEDNIKELPAIIEFAHAHGISQVIFAAMRASGLAALEGHILDKRSPQINQWREAFEAMRCVSVERKIRVSTDPCLNAILAPVEIDRTKPLDDAQIPVSIKTRICTDPWKFLSIFYEGTTTPCCFRAANIGNAFTAQEPLWKSAALARIRHGLLADELSGPCKTCSMRHKGSLDQLKLALKQIGVNVSAGIPPATT